ncbi:MAG: sulfite exporter TauE/SafE family protein, partial [Desulfobacterales bacterium]
LPCGPVYTALIASAGAGVDAQSAFSGFVSGSGVMIAFGIGTLPALLLVGKLSDLGWLKARALIYKIGALFMILAGAYFIFKGIRY